MELLSILFCISIFLIAIVMLIIKKMFFRWKEEHKSESKVVVFNVERPAVSVMITVEKCVLRRRSYGAGLGFYDIISKSDISLTKQSEEDPFKDRSELSLITLAPKMLALVVEETEETLEENGGKDVKKDEPVYI